MAVEGVGLIPVEGGGGGFVVFVGADPAAVDFVRFVYIVYEDFVGVKGDEETGGSSEDLNDDGENKVTNVLGFIGIVFAETDDVEDDAGDGHGKDENQRYEWKIIFFGWAGIEIGGGRELGLRLRWRGGRSERMVDGVVVA